jgi:hypothetical protein
MIQRIHRGIDVVVVRGIGAPSAGRTGDEIDPEIAERCRGVWPVRGRES